MGLEIDKCTAVGKRSLCFKNMVEYFLTTVLKIYPMCYYTDFVFRKNNACTVSLCYTKLNHVIIFQYYSSSIYYT